MRSRFERGDRVALEHTDDPHTKLRPGDEGTVTRYNPGLGQLDVGWDSGSTLSMLLDEGDRVRLIAPARPGKPGRSRAGERLLPAARSPGGRAAPGRGPRPPARPGRRVLQIGESSSRREFYRELLGGIASADPATTGLYAVPDLTARWDYERDNLAADLGLADGDPALDQAAGAYLAAAREEFWLEAARLARRRLTPGAGDETEDGTEPEDPGDGEPAPDWRQDISDPATGLSRLLSERCGTCILRAGDPMHLGPERTAAFIRRALAEGTTRCATRL